MNEPNPAAEEALFEAALEQGSEAERGAFLENACRGNPQLRARLDELLEGYFGGAGFLTENPGGALAVNSARVAASEPLSLMAGRYKLLEKIGEGGFGEVWMAEQREPVRRRVALKIIKLGMDTRHVIGRFEAERQALALMDHPNIAKILDAGTVETTDSPRTTLSGRPYFVMELVRGIKITEYCEQNRLSLPERLKLFIPVCQAIQHAHQKGIIHRDIKPSNILVTLHDGVPVPKVIDFGIAKATQGELTDKTVFTQFQHFMGTPEYISPEQAEMSSLDVDTRSDIYSLGVVLYELLVGQPPFGAKELLRAGLDEMRRIIREVEPVRPSTCLTRQRAVREASVQPPRPPIDPDLDWIVMKCLEKDRTRRYDTANGLAMDLRRYLTDEPVLARPPSTLYQVRKLARRHRGLVIVTVVVAVALVSILGLSLAYGWRERAHALQLQRDLALQHLVRGQNLCRQGDVTRGLHWLAKALEETPENQTDLLATIRQNLGSWRGRVQVPLAAFPHEGTTRIVDFSSDGSLLLTGGEDQTVRLWRSGTGEPVGPPLRHEGAVLRGQFSPDGRQVLTASRDRTVRLWSAPEGTLSGVEFRHEADPTVALFSPDGTRVLSASRDGAVRLWSAQTGQPLSPWLQHGAAVRAAAFVPDGTLFLTAGADGVVRFWSGDRGETQGESLRHSGEIRAFSVSPDGRQCLIGSGDHSARLWSIETRQALGPPLVHRGPVNTVAFSPNGSQLLTGGADGVARLWSATSGQPSGFEMQHGAPVLVARFTPDGRRVVTGSENNSAMFWSAETGQVLGAPIRHEGWVSAVAFSPDGRQMLTGADDHSAKLWATEPGGAGELILPHGKSVKSATFSPDGLRILTGGGSNDLWHGSARLWSVQTGEPGPVLPHPGLVWAVVFSADGRSILTGGHDGRAQLWSASTLEPGSTQFRHSFDVRCAVFSKEGRWVASGGFDRTAVVWSTRTGEAAFPGFTHPQYVEDVAFSPDGTLLATACGDGLVRLWSLESGRATGPVFRHNGSVLAVTFSPDGRQLLTGSTDRFARLWEVRTGRPSGRAFEHPAWVEDVAFSPDGTRVATGDAFNSAWLWSRATGELLAPPFEHTGPVNEIEFSPDGRQLLTASHDGTARVWTFPEPFDGSISQVRSWVEALTGQAMDEHGALSWLDAATWRVRKEENSSRR